MNVFEFREETPPATRKKRKKREEKKEEKKPPKSQIQSPEKKEVSLNWEPFPPEIQSLLETSERPTRTLRGTKGDGDEFSKFFDSDLSFFSKN